MTTPTTDLSFPCPDCGYCDEGDDCSLSINLQDVSVLVCRECEATFTTDDLAEHAKKILQAAELLRRLSGKG
jgi:transcription elongation factor Elf1